VPGTALRRLMTVSTASGRPQNAAEKYGDNHRHNYKRGSDIHVQSLTIKIIRARPQAIPLP